MFKLCFISLEDFLNKFRRILYSLKSYKHASYFLSHMEYMIKWTEETYSSIYRIIFIVFDTLKKK